MSEKIVEKTEEEVAGRGLLDLVFSWSIRDVRNRDLYKNQVKEIPETFMSMSHYMKSFIPALIEETRADLCSNLMKIPQASTREIFSIERSKEYKPPKDLFYKMWLKRMRNTGYEPEVGDLLALTYVRPKDIADLNRPGICYVLAYVHRLSDNTPENKFTKEAAIAGQEMQNKRRDSVFVVYLANMTTNVRIWRSLHSDLQGGNTNVIQNVLGTSSPDSQDCTHCLSEVINRRD
ncbi:hypothetical protein OIU76_027855 [Salix suchowensis]|nr:hypothetical protein OIU76_027855 [Salix suchowensis]